MKFNFWNWLWSWTHCKTYPRPFVWIEMLCSQHLEEIEVQNKHGPNDGKLHVCSRRWHFAFIVHPLFLQGLGKCMKYVHAVVPVGHNCDNNGRSRILMDSAWNSKKRRPRQCQTVFPWHRKHNLTCVRKDLFLLRDTTKGCMAKRAVKTNCETRGNRGGKEVARALTKWHVPRCYERLQQMLIECRNR